MLSVRGKFKDGVVELLEPVEGRDGQPVIITFLERAIGEESEDEIDTAWSRLIELVETHASATGISDLAHQHEHYLHGKPKKE